MVVSTVLVAISGNTWLAEASTAVAPGSTNTVPTVIVAGLLPRRVIVGDVLSPADGVVVPVIGEELASPPDERRLAFSSNAES